MNTDNLCIKLKNLIKIAKNYNFEPSGLFSLWGDSEGWTDGFLANLKSTDKDIMQAKAIIYRQKNQNFRCVNEANEGPKIKPILSRIDNDQYEPVMDIEWDILTNSLILISETSKELVNPVYVKYFATVYKNMIVTDIFICKNINMSPVEIKIDNDRVGLIMPIRHDFSL